MRLRSRILYDRDEFVRRMQRSQRCTRLHLLAAELREAYLRAELVVGEHTELGAAVASFSSCNWHSLKCWYSIVAGEFRYQYVQAIVQPELPGLLDNLTHRQRLVHWWDEFYAREAEALCHERPETARHMLIAMLTRGREELAAAGLWLALDCVARYEHYHVVRPNAGWSE